MEPEPERTLEYYREKAEEEAALRREVELELAVAQRRVACLEHRSLVAALTASFRLFDHDGDGFIVDAENMAVANTVQHYRPQFCDPAAEEIFARLQRSAIQADDGTEGGNDDGQISLEEFLSFGLRCFESVDEEAAVRTINGVNDALRSLLELDAEMKTLFELFDTDGSGGITVDENVEVAKLLSALAGETSARSGACRRTVVSSAFDEQACRDKFAATVSSHDANRDKQISFDEFRKFYLRDIVRPYASVAVAAAVLIGEPLPTVLDYSSALAKLRGMCEKIRAAKRGSRFRCCIANTPPVLPSS